ncbi:MAG TPA: hypothetical protein VHX61_20070 [Rhizomicrobium sp.]|jgi:hypothetical protein|nr:hypothetical protein [Rhizomicrobium sp.]
MTTNDGGSGGVLPFLGKGQATFASLASPLSINGQPYTLVDSIASLATAVAANPGGYYALANDYDARVGGVYTASPIPEVFDGTFEGLGNTISHLRVRDRVKFDAVGLFAELGEHGAVNGLRLSGVDLLGGDGNAIGGIVGGDSAHGECDGSLVNDSVSGTIHGLGGFLAGGGLAGCVDAIAYSSSSATVYAKRAEFIGGLAGGGGGSPAHTLPAQ